MSVSGLFSRYRDVPSAVRKTGDREALVALARGHIAADRSGMEGRAQVDTNTRTTSRGGFIVGFSGGFVGWRGGKIARPDVAAADRRDRQPAEG